MGEANLYITVLFIKQGDRWLAQALEYDLAAQGDNVDLAKRAFERTFQGQLELDRRMKRVGLSNLPKAPAVYWEMFRRLVQDRTPMTTEPIETDIPSDTPPAFMVKAFPSAVDHIGVQ
jgi:hypothetical protein